MGLDMWLERESYVKNWDHEGAAGHWDITVSRGGRPYPYIEPSRISTITEEVMYWRKDNWIHNWFVRECQEGRDECQRVLVDPLKLLELLMLLNRIIEDPTVAPELLPIAEDGFFFGMYAAPGDLTPYEGDWYIDSIKQTAAMLEGLNLEAEVERGRGDFYYHSSW